MLDDDRVLGHPWILGEISLGRLPNGQEVLRLLANLLQAVVATHGEMVTLIETHELWGRGLRFVDAQLLAATLLSRNARLLTRDKRLSAVQPSSTALPRSRTRRESPHGCQHGSAAAGFPRTGIIRLVPMTGD